MLAPLLAVLSCACALCLAIIGMDGRLPTGWSDQPSLPA